MQPTQDKYPVFEANQVLTNAHLNEFFNYLDEQERLTRSNLIGIGIVCGLEIQLEVAASTSILLSKGCGITSEGYLIVEPEDVSLVSYRADYILPNELDYQPFKDPVSKVQYPLWELFPAGEPNTTLLGAAPDFLNDKAVVLFLELKKESLRNCSPNNCDDKGSEVTATVRRLLIKVDDLSKFIAAANQLNEDFSAGDLANILMNRMNLPDLRLPRYNVINTSLATTDNVLTGFLNVFQIQNGGLKLVNATADALSKAYDAFKPILEKDFPGNPFNNFNGVFGFLDNGTPSSTQKNFLQYYYDLFDDLLRAYDEFRWKGMELLCECCPPEELFPRHLMLGVLFPSLVTNSSIYRQYFTASSAISNCEERTKELKQLFQRMVEMSLRFTNAPPLPATSSHSSIDPQIRITPSKLLTDGLSEKAIPYYYLQNGSPRLYELWNFKKTKLNRANQNLSYRSDEYAPVAPVFVLNAMRYDIEAYNFLRIEGHLGKSYQNVLATLLNLKASHRLPIEIIALQTGTFDESITIDPTTDECRFEDLESLYDAFREELLRTLCEGIRYLYDIFMDDSLPAVTPQLPVLMKYAPFYVCSAGSIGSWYEKNLSVLQAKPYIDVDQNNINSGVALYALCVLSIGTAPVIPDTFYSHIVSIYYLSKLSEILPDELSSLNYPDFENKYQDLIGLVRFFRSEAKNTMPQQLQHFMPKEELIDHFDEVLFNCKLDVIKSIYNEYRSRITKIKQKQYLSYFLSSNPGIQHKAGVPVGGTFIVVYHGDNETTDSARIFNIEGASEFTPGQVIADFYLPYICCSDCSPIQFVLPKVPPVLKVESISCTNAEGFAEVTVTQTGGLTPYTLKVDGNPYGDFVNTLSLSAGSHLLTIKDSEGTESTPVSVDIVQPLFISETNFDCFGDGNQYVSICQITGGTAPYTANLGSISGNIYTSDLLPGNTNSEIIITDSRNCTAFIVLNHSCLAPLSATFQTACTNEMGTADVSIFVTGGLPPYSINVDLVGYVPINSPIQLTPGPHVVSVKDMTPSEFFLPAITVPNQLVFGTETYVDNFTSNTYQVIVTISGGVGSYTVLPDSGSISGATFTSVPVVSGNTMDVIITDAAGCKVSKGFVHSLENPCQLPCKGITLISGYRLWIPESEPNAPFETYGTEVHEFMFEFPQGGEVNLDLGDVQNIIQASANDLNTDFTNVVDAWLKKLNNLIADTIGDPNWLKLSYSKLEKEPVGTLWIEYFECLKFEFQIQSFYKRPSIPENMAFIYTPEGTTIKNINTENDPVFIPPYNPTEINKCDPTQRNVELCADVSLKLKLKLAKTGFNTFTFDVIQAGSDVPVVYFWEIQDGAPSVSNSKKVDVSFLDASEGTKIIRLTAFTSKGCSVTASGKVDVDKNG